MCIILDADKKTFTVPWSCQAICNGINDIEVTI